MRDRKDRTSRSPLPLREEPRAKGLRGRGPQIVRARELRKESTEAEKKLWNALRRKNMGGLRFRRQYPLGPYFADFVCLPARLVVEVDGESHAEEAQIRHDRVRTAWLRSQRFRVIRFWNSDVFENIDGVLDVIADVVRKPPPPTPSRMGRGKVTL